MMKTPHDPSAVTAPAAPVTRSPRTSSRSFGRRTSDTLGLSWLHGALHAAVFHRQTLTGSWTSPVPVSSIEDFETALDGAITALEFRGEEVFLVLAHEQFVHQSEQGPSFSEAAARSYLRGRVDRYEKDHEPVLWVSQRTLSARQEAAFLLHLLPSAFYDRLNSALLSRRLDLTRILPLTVPLQLMLEGFDGPKDHPALVAIETGGATTLLAARPDGQLLFARTMMAEWKTDPARLGVEVNRSLLYAKQQFSAVIERVWLLGASDEKVIAEVTVRCGTGKTVIARAAGPVDWLQAVARLTPRHPVNLVAGYLGRKRRFQFIRRSLIASCWLIFALLALDGWARSAAITEDRQRLATLLSNEAELRAEHERLGLRNVEVERRRAFIRQMVDERLPAVPSRFLAVLASALPVEAYLTDCQVKWEEAGGQWTVRLEGQIEGDEDTARESLAAFRKILSRSQLGIRFSDSSRVLSPIMVAGAEQASSHRFTLEGTLFEN